MKKKETSDLDLETWEEYINNPKDIFDKELKSNPKTQTRFRFDLHGFTLNDATKKVNNIIRLASEKGYKEILLITGKGIHSNTEKDTYVSSELSKLRFSIPDFINNNSELSNLIISINTAEKKDGGEGALIIKLKKLTK